MNISQIFNNCINSLIFTDINNENLDLLDLMKLHDLIDANLIAIINVEKSLICCSKIPEFHILTVIDWLIYFNTNDYKCNSIMRNLVYILYYYIQDRRNITKLYKSKYNSKNGITLLRELMPNIICIKPVIKNLLKRIINEIDDHIQESRLYVKQILYTEMITLPTDLINIILGYMSDIQVLETAEMF